MRTPRLVATLGLSLLCALGAAACVEETDGRLEAPQATSENEATATAAEALEESDHEAEETIAETLQSAGYESPSPGPGVVLPGGHDPGGPGAGWGRGFADDPSYAPYFAPHDPDPYKEQRHARQREYDRIRAENGRHGGSGQSTGIAHRDYPGGKQAAPDAPWPPLHTGNGPLDDKARCEDECFNKYLDDAAYCKRLPEHERRRCQEEAAEKMALCFRECSRKYPGN